MTDKTPDLLESPLEASKIRATEIKSSIKGNKNYWILGGFIVVLLLLVILLGAKLRGLATKLDILESKSSLALTTSIVKQDHGEIDASPDGIAQIKSDIVKALPIVQQINSLVPKIDSLSMNPQPLTQNPVKPNVRPVALKPANPAANAEMKWWRHVVDKFWAPIRNFFHDLVKIQVIDSHENSPSSQGLALSPASQQLLKQELGIHLLSARQFVLAGLPSQALEDINQTHALVAKNFAIQTQSVEQFIDELEKIQMQLKSNLPQGGSSSSPTTTGKK
jgi:hypothetical protein